MSASGRCAFSLLRIRLGGCRQPLASGRGIGLVLEGTIISAFDNDRVEIITAGQSFTDSASFRRVSRNARQTEPTKFLIVYTVRNGEPNTV
jgi:hypothetical protein